MENGLLYLFTTIAQALAGAIALLAAFALYRMQTIEAEKAGLAKLIVQGFKDCGESGWAQALYTLATERRYEKFLSERERAMKVLTSPHASAPPEYITLQEPQVARITVALSAESTIRRGLWGALKVTAVVMVFAVAMTPLAHVIACIPWLAWSVAALGVLAFCSCLWRYYALIAAALGTQAAG